MQQLPSLHALRAFEAVSRHLSFTHAARELNVQQPAVSRQIADLEADLGIPLFLRTKPRLTPTPDGERLANAVSQGFSTITQAVRDIRSQTKSGLLTIDVSIGFASCWLLARIADFQEKHPEIDVQISTRDANHAYNLATSDVVILFGDGTFKDFESRRIFSEEMFPICSPDLVPDDQDLSLEDLLQKRLLHIRDSQHDRDWMTLLSPAGLMPPPPKPGAEFNSYIVYLQAILNGEGIGVGWKTLMDDLIAMKRLRPVTNHRLATERGYFCCIPKGLPVQSESVAFSDWICELTAFEPG